MQFKHSGAGVDMETKAAYMDRTLSGLGNRRQLPRRNLDARAHVLPLDGRLKRFWCVAENLSHKGVFLRTRRALPLGSLIVMRLHVGKGAALWKLTGEVVQRVRGVGIGCRFVDVGPQTSVAIGKLVAWTRAAPMPLRTMGSPKATRSLKKKREQKQPPQETKVQKRQSTDRTPGPWLDVVTRRFRRR
jgi:hypothetical protein